MTTTAMQSFRARAIEAYEREISDNTERKRIDWLQSYEAARARIARQFTDRLGIPREPTDVQLLDSDAPFPEMQKLNSDSDGAYERPYTVWVEDVRFVAFSGGALYVVNRCSICQREWLARADHDDIGDIGEALAELHDCEDPNRPAKPEPTRTNAALRRDVLSRPEVAVEGGSDSDNLAVIAHNLGAIAQRLDDFFDCGASMAGRGV